MSAEYYLLDDISMLNYNVTGLTMEQRIVKRCMDIGLSLVMMIVTSPIWLVSAAAIKIYDGGPVFFKQDRATINGNIFQVYKFRTMKEHVENRSVSEDDNRITPPGKILRKIRMDELPQLINILKGDMAVVGPRPALWNQDDLLAERERYGANDIRPGLTGWAQIHGRDELEIPEKAMLDGYYVEHMCFALDVKCFFGTIRSVTYTEGVVEGGTGTLQREAKQEEYANE